MKVEKIVLPLYDNAINALERALLVQSNSNDWKDDAELFNGAIEDRLSLFYYYQKQNYLKAIEYCIKALNYKPDDENELEFIIEKDGEVLPIEVKAGNTATKSLNRYIDKYNPSIAYKIMAGNIGEVDKKLSIPHYMAMFI